MAIAVRRVLRRLDHGAIGRGAATYLAVAVPFGVIIAAAKGHDTAGNESNLWVLAAVVVLLVAPLAGGYVAGDAGRGAPLLHGAVAVAGPAGLFLLARAAIGLIQANLTLAQAVSFALFLQVFTGLAVFGGYLASRRRAS